MRSKSRRSLLLALLWFTVSLVGSFALPAAWAQVAGSDVGGRNRHVGVDAQVKPVPLGTRPGAPPFALPTVANSVVLKVGRGPVVAWWTGELFGTDATSEIIFRFDAEECLDAACSTTGPPIVATPHIESPPGDPFFNYVLRALNGGFSFGTSTVHAVWLTGALIPNRKYRFSARLAHFDGLHTGPPGGADPALVVKRTLTVEVFSED
jgi:hypothetical protein